MTPPISILEMLDRHCIDRGPQAALVVDRGQGYETVAWREIHADVGRAAIALFTVGFSAETVLLVSENRYEWLIADLALQSIHAVCVPASPLLPGAELRALAERAGARHAIVSTLAIAAELALAEQEIGIFSFDATQAIFEPSSRIIAPWSVVYRSGGAGRRLGGEYYGPRPDRSAAIIYTSGTDGDPKGVTLTHGNLAFDAWATWQAFGNPATERRFGLLPWSHAFARTCDLYAWIVSGTVLIVGRGRETAIADIRATAPTYLNGVPYFFEKLQRACVAGSTGEPNIRDLLGPSLRACCSGGAPLPGEVFDFYQAQGLPVLEGYGLTEAGPCVATCTETNFRRGSVGRALPGVELQIAEDGEVLTRGSHVMRGYHNDPVATAAAIDTDGWLHTGDLGRLDADGYLYLTGRKKELIVLATGQKVSPAVIESLLQQDPLIVQSLVVGDGKKHLAAMLVFDREAYFALEGELDLFAVIQARIDRQLAGRAPHEQLRRWSFTLQPFTQEAGELTAKQTLRRDVLAKRFESQITDLFLQRPLALPSAPPE